MSEEQIEERKGTVLRAIVRDYIRTAEPVGSGTIAKRYRLGVSSATIRSEMAALEEMGYLVQPHTSAGRVPTDHGYRHYVDHLPPRIRLPRGAQAEVETFFGEPPADVDDLFHETAAFLSKLTGYAALALSPQLDGSTVAKAELVPVSAGVMLLVVSDSGRVDKRLLDLGTEPDPRIVEGASRILSQGLAGLTYEEAAERASALAREIAVEERRLLRDVADAIRDLSAAGTAQAFLGGVANIAGEPAFEQRETLRELVEALEERVAVLEVVRAASDAMGDVTVRIGAENPLAALAEASVVVAWYGSGERPAGAIALVGPTRMEYARAIPTAKVVAGRLSDLIAGLSA